MNRAQLEDALRSAMRMRQAFPQGSAEWQACVDKELELRKRLSMPPPDPGSLNGGPRGPRAASPRGMVDVNPSYVDDTANPSRGGGAYQEDYSRVDDPGYLDNRSSIEEEGYFRHANVAAGGGGEAVPQPPPPPVPPAPPVNGEPHSSDVRSMPTAPSPGPAASPRPRGLGRLPRIQFDSTGEMIAWGATAATLVFAGYKAYRNFKEGR